MVKKKGFTLIELLVVLAIIALLLAIIIPAVKMAKRKAASAVCLTNVKNLSLAWYTYQAENDGRLMSGNPDRPYAWIKHPMTENGVELYETTMSPQVSDDDEKRGIEQGIMYAYGIDNYDVYHCPVDNMRKSKYDGTTIFRTYSIPACLNGGGGDYVRKFTEINSPSMRYNFVEEAEGRNFNSGTWSFYTPYDGIYGDWEWRDPIGVNHGDSGVLGFCDGHAEVHVWQDPFTKKRVEYFYQSSLSGYGQAFNEEYRRPWDQTTDLYYMGRGWAYPK